MTAIGTPHMASPAPALLLLCLFMLILGVTYHHVLTGSNQRLEQVQSSFERVAWIAAAEPAWRAELNIVRRSLQDELPFLRASQPQAAAAELQSRIRQALMAAGSSVESLQSSVKAPMDGNLPSVRVVIVTRTAPERIVDALRALEELQTPLGFESVDVAVQQTGGSNAPQRVAILTIAVRSFAHGDHNADE